MTCITHSLKSIMKIKVSPEDFVVEELIDLSVAKRGPYTILKLQKRYWNTLDVIDFCARKLSVSKKLFSRAGLKDRYSLSTQYLSFKGHLREIIREKNFTLVPVGKTQKPILPHFMVGNSFSIILRSLNNTEIDKISKNYHIITKHGMPNYFDEQRFGSVRHRKGFFAKELMLKHYKGALKLLLCYPYKEDRRQEKIFKNFCNENWGKWQGCLRLAPKKYRRIINYLIYNPKDYKNAIKTIDKELLNIYLLAYQSYLFNQTVNYVIEEHGIDNANMPYSVGHFLFYSKLKTGLESIKKIKIPILNEKVILKGHKDNIIKSVLDKEGIKLKDFALKKMRFRDVRFKSFLRPIILFPKNFHLGKIKDDEIYKNKKKIKLKFTLPPGSYATLLIKRLLV